MLKTVIPTNKKANNKNGDKNKLLKIKNISKKSEKNIHEKKNNFLYYNDLINRYKLETNKNGKKENTIAKATRQERQITHGPLSLSLKSLITNDHLSQLWNLERLEALIVSFNGLLALVLNVEDWNAWMI